MKIIFYAVRARITIIATLGRMIKFSLTLPQAPPGLRGLSCVATVSVSVGNFRKARLVPRVVIATVADVSKNNGGRPAGPRAAPPRRALSNCYRGAEGLPRSVIIHDEPRQSGAAAEATQGHHPVSSCTWPPCAANTYQGEASVDEAMTDHHGHSPQPAETPDAPRERRDGPGGRGGLRKMTTAARAKSEETASRRRRGVLVDAAATPRPKRVQLLWGSRVLTKGHTTWNRKI